MGKRKPDQTITHRIELQQTERDTLEAALAGRFVTNGITAVGSAFGNVLSGFGAMLVPFQGVITALGVLWIGDKTIDEAKKILEDTTSEAVDYVFPQLGDAQSMYMFVSNWLQAQDNNWGYVFAHIHECIEYLEEQNAYPWLIEKVREFRNVFSTLWNRNPGHDYNAYPEVIWGMRDRTDLLRAEAVNGMNFARWWAQFYPTTAYLRDIKANILPFGLKL